MPDAETDLQRSADEFLQQPPAADDGAAVKTLQAEIKRLKDRLAGVEVNRELVLRAVQEAYTEPPELIITPPPSPRPGVSAAEIAVLHVSDTHFGKLTQDYDGAACRTRMQLLARKVMQITGVRRTHAAIDELRIYLGGDLLEGEQIFPTQAHQIDCSLFRQALRDGPAVYAELVLSLTQYFRKVRVVCVAGNHGRNGGKHTTSSPETNWDNVLYDVVRHMVQLALARNAPARYDDVTWDMAIDRPEGGWYALDRVYGWGNLIVHGHEIRGGFAGYPYYGVGKKAYGWIDVIPDGWDYMFHGHFHTAARTDYNRRVILANGSSESTNTHARQELSAMGYPQQRLCYFNETTGLISDDIVYLAERRPNR